MVCFKRAEGVGFCGSGTVGDGKVSNLMVTLDADASAAFCRSSLRTVLCS